MTYRLSHPASVILGTVVGVSFSLLLAEQRGDSCREANLQTRGLTGERDCADDTNNTIRNNSLVTTKLSNHSTNEAKEQKRQSQFRKQQLSWTNCEIATYFLSSCRFWENWTEHLSSCVGSDGPNRYCPSFGCPLCQQHKVTTSIHPRRRWFAKSIVIDTLCTPYLMLPHVLIEEILASGDGNGKH
jgi:gas vesicle protein